MLYHILVCSPKYQFWPLGSNQSVYLDRRLQTRDLPESLESWLHQHWKIKEKKPSLFFYQNILYGHRVWDKK